MPANLYFDAETKSAIASTICALVSDGKHMGVVLAAVGISPTLWWDWRAADPQLHEAFARAQENYAEGLVLRCPEVAENAALDAKSRRVIVDTNLKVAALLCPRRFSQAALDRMAAPPEEDDRLTVQELAAQIRASITVAKRLPAPIDAEFTDVDEE